MLAVCGSKIKLDFNSEAMDLHKQSVQLGSEKNKIQNKLLALLPEIFESGIYKKYTRTIEGYAWQFAQIPQSAVQKTLRVEKYIAEFPHLKAAVAKVGIHKVSLVATLATAENEEVLADKIKHMSKPAVQTMSKEMRGHKTEKMTIELEGEMMMMFLKLKKQYGSNKEVMRALLEMASPGIEPCVYPDCHKPAEHDHHPERKSLVKGTKITVPLCKEHHEFMHNGLVENELEEPKKWKFTLNGVLDQADLLRRKYWLEYSR